MNPLHEPTPTTTLAPRKAHRRRWLGGLAAGALLAATLGVSACGLGSGSSGSATILNTEKVERAIEQSSLDQRGKNARVTCPAGVHQKKGLEFSCMATVKRATTRFVVTQTDGAGHVHYAAR
jgi:hypothetical protein